jgi:hypothetical protein
MKSFLSSVFLSYLVVSMTGCADGNWVTMKNGRPADTSEKRVDSLRCEREAASTYPFAQVITSTSGGGFGNSSTTNCYGDANNVSCTTSGGILAPEPKVTTTDGNASNRSNYYHSCMTALGYESVFVPAPQPANSPQRATSPQHQPNNNTTEPRDAAALTALGERYARGDGVPKDPVRAVELFRKAANQGFAAAINDLGAMYANGEGVGQSYSEALSLYRVAAERGSPQANANLGNAYEIGQGVTKNYNEALAWYRKSADLGHKVAKQRIAVIEKVLNQQNQTPQTSVAMEMKARILARNEGCDIASINNMQPPAGSHFSYEISCLDSSIRKYNCNSSDCSVASVTPPMGFQTKSKSK